MGQANTKNSTIRPLTSQCKLAAVPTATRVRRIRRMARKLQRQLTNGELLGPREHGTWDDLAEDQHKRDRHNHRHKLRHNHVEKDGECLVLPAHTALSDRRKCWQQRGTYGCTIRKKQGHQHEMVARYKRLDLLHTAHRE